MRPLPAAVAERIGAQLLSRKDHPLGIVRNRIETYFQSSSHPLLTYRPPIDPTTTVSDAFDNLLIPNDHPSRRESDTFYVSPNQVLRPQATAYQRYALNELRGTGSTAIWSCDVYRRDEVDKTHFPVFHQLDGVRIWNATAGDFILADLKETLEGLVKHLWVGQRLEFRWDETATFPFTNPSLEMEMRLPDQPWVEVLGAGIIKKDLLLPSECGWAFGIGLERIAMLLWGIHDIRLFWSEDERWKKQWTGDVPNGHKFKAFSSFPKIEKDLSFWVPRNFQVNDFFELCREVGGQELEEVKLVDRFERVSGSAVYSHCYRFTYQSFSKTLTHEEVNAMQETIRVTVVDKLGVQLR